MPSRIIAAAPSIQTVFALALLSGAFSVAYATLEARDLDADGPLYLIGALRHDGFAFFEPARKTVQFLQQSFSYAGFRVGLTDLSVYGRLLTLGMQGWPLLLTVIAWVILPLGKKEWILGPLLNFIVVIPATSLIGTGEGMIASGLMWILYFLTEFRIRRVPSALAAVFLASACFYLHEAAFPFMMGIAVLSFMRANRTTGVPRFCLYVVALLCVLSSFHLLYYVLFPRDAGERGAFLQGLVVDFLATLEGPGVNLSSIAAIAVAFCLFSVHFPRNLAEPERQVRVVRACKISGAIFGIIAILFLAIPEWVIAPHTYVAARGWPIIATTAMAVFIHFLLRADWTAGELAPSAVRLVLAGIVALQLLAQTVMTAHWALYRQDLATFVATHKGIIPWQIAYQELNPHHTIFRWHFVYAWSVQPLSIVLAPHGKVRSAVDGRPGIRWEPFQLDDPTTLPLCAIGFDWSPYLAALGKMDASPRTGCPSP